MINKYAVKHIEGMMHGLGVSIDQVREVTEGASISEINEQQFTKLVAALEYLQDEEREQRAGAAGSLDALPARVRELTDMIGMAAGGDRNAAAKLTEAVCDHLCDCVFDKFLGEELE